MVSARRTIRTMCPMNCHPTLCGMLVEVEDGRLIGVKGDPENPDSQGFLCIRGQASREIIGNPKRVLFPLVRDRRTDGAWRRASWDEALELVVARMRSAGREAVGFWQSHGHFANNYGTRIASQLLRRFANFYGCQWWHPAIICWGLGGFGIGLTGPLETNTKEDMGAHANLILLWGANLASQPNTARHLAAAKRRGAGVVTIDVRHTEAAAQSDEAFVVRPGTDAALALALMHVIIGEGLYNRKLVETHTVGFDRLIEHVRAYPPEWAANETGLTADRIVALARRYATTRPAMILLGGSSMHKGANGWQGGRAVACLPALTGNLGIPGGGLGPRHGSASHGQALGTIIAMARRPPGRYVPSQMSRITEALLDGRVRVLFLLGTDMLSSFADAERVAAGLAQTNLIVTHDLFMNDTARRFADVVLPATAWLEELGCKSTNTHLYLMPKILNPPGEARSLTWILRELARRLDLADFFPWETDEGPIDAILDHPATGHATVAALRAEGGIRALRISHVAHPDLAFPTPSGKVEFYSERARSLGLPALPVYVPLPASDRYPLSFRQGRTLTQFHGFYDHGRALPTLARLDPEPKLWVSPADAAARCLEDGAPIRIFNDRGEFPARAHVTDRVPPGTVWMRDGWTGLNRLTAGVPAIPDEAVDAFDFSAGQAAFDAMVEVVRNEPGPVLAGADPRKDTAMAKASQPATPVSFDVPAGGCDCHTHIHGDPEKFPFFAGRVYTPETASPEEMAALHRALHIERVVIVTPSVYGTDNSATLYGMKARGANARGVAVVDEKTPEAELDSMGRAGVRGIRLNLATGGINDPTLGRRRFQTAVERIKSRNWHVQMYTNLAMISALKDLVAASPVGVVFDHFGGAQAEPGLRQPGFADLLDLVRTGQAYVKISAAYRASKLAPDYVDVVPLAQALIAANPDRILWGTDWPHPNSTTPAGQKPTDVTPLFQIDDGRLLNQLSVWAPSPELRKKILVDNPARLYGF